MHVSDFLWMSFFFSHRRTSLWDQICQSQVVAHLRWLAGHVGGGWAETLSVCSQRYPDTWGRRGLSVSCHTNRFTCIKHLYAYSHSATVITTEFWLLTVLVWSWPLPHLCSLTTSPCWHVAQPMIPKVKKNRALVYGCPTPLKHAIRKPVYFSGILKH